MIEKIIIDFLSAHETVPVWAEVPHDPPEDFLIVEKTGGGRRNRLKTAMVAVLPLRKRRQSST